MEGSQVWYVKPNSGRKKLSDSGSKVGKKLESLLCKKEKNIDFYICNFTALVKAYLLDRINWKIVENLFIFMWILVHFPVHV